MSSVDNRIVNMQFNNKQFVAGAAESKRSLEDLEKGLAGAGKAGGLQEMGKAADGVAARFSALQVVGVTALANIANSAVNSAKNFAAEFSGIKSMGAGFSEYELKMGAIQTIMAGSGKSMDVVNKKLEELNKYSDQTIYSFADMTQNIGKFTNAGVDLNTSVAAIKGIANAAALSGANSNEASRAMYNFSQAISSGSVKLIDWKSIELANMGTAEFKQQLIDTAVEVGTLTKRGDEYVTSTGKTLSATKGFNDSLQDQWLTSQALTDTLERYADDTTDIGKRATKAASDIKTFSMLTDTLKENLQSGWAMSAEYIFGNLTQATKLWNSIGTTVGDFFTKTAKKRNDMLKEWNKADDGGRTALLESLGRIATSLGGILKAVGKAWRDVFPPSSGNIMITITKAFEAFSKKLVASKDTLDNVRTIFSAVFSVLKLGFGIVGGIALAFGKLFGALFSGSGQATGGILDMIAGVASVITKFQEWVTESVKIREVLGSIGTVAGSVIKPIVAFVGMLVEAFTNLASGKGLTGFKAPFEGLRGMMAKFLADIFGGLAALTSPFEKLSGWFEGLQTKFEGVASSLGAVTAPTQEFSDAVRNLTSLSADGKMLSIKANAEKLAGSMTDLSGSTKKVKDAVNTVGDSLAGLKGEETTAGMQKAASGAASGWGSISDAMSMLGDGIKKTFSMLGDAVSWVKEQFQDLFGGLDAFEWAAMLNTILTGTAILAIKDFTKSLKTMFEGFGGIGSEVKGTFGQLTGTLKTFQAELKAKMLMTLAIAIGILVAALIALSFVKVKPLQRGLAALGGVLAMVAGLLFVMTKMPSATNSITSIGTGLMLLSIGIMALAAAVIMLGKQDLMVLVKGIGALVFIMGILAGVMKKFAYAKGQFVAVGAAMVMLAFAVNLLVPAIAMLGNMDLTTLAKGIGAMAFGLGLMVAPLAALGAVAGAGGKLVAAAAAIMVVAVALTVMASVVAIFGNMDVKTLAIGFGAMAVGLGMMIGPLVILGLLGPVVLAAAGAIFILAQALLVMSTVVGILGNMSPETLAVGFTAMAIGLGLFIAAGALAGMVAPGLIVLATALMMFGGALALAGLGMMLFSTGLALMVALGAAGIAIIVLAIQTFMAMLPSIAVQVAAAFIGFLEVIAKASPKIRKSMNTIIKNLLGMVKDAIPHLKELFSELISAGIEIIREKIPEFVDAGFEMIDELLKSANAHIPSISDSAYELVETFLGEIEEKIPRLVDAGFDMIIGLLDGITETLDTQLPELRRAVKDLAWEIIDGLTGGLLDRGYTAIKDAVSELTGWIPNWIKKKLGMNSPSKVTYALGEYTSMGMAMGIKAGAKSVVAATVAMVDAMVTAGRDGVEDILKLANQAENQANKAAARADIAAKKAQEARRKANQFEKKNPKAKDRIKTLNKEADDLEKAAGRADRLAQRRQEKSDERAQELQDRLAFEESDQRTKADMKMSEAETLSNEAQRMLALSQEKRKEADKLMEENKKLGRAALKRAKEDAEIAKNLANQAKAALAEAQGYYLAEVADRIAQLESDAAYQAAESSGNTGEMANILKSRANSNELLAKQERAAAEALIAQAKAVQDSNAAEALRLVELAEQAAANAKAAADAAKQQRDEAERLMNPNTGGGVVTETPTGSVDTTGSNSPAIRLSRSILEDAASAIDRYTASLQQAELYAGATPGATQYIQNINSPAALSTSEIYRQSKNLLSVAEHKIGISPIPVNTPATK